MRAQIMRRRKQYFISDSIIVASRLPWWGCISLAIISYFILKYIGDIKVQPEYGIENIGQILVKQILVTLSMFGKYIVPVIFISGAAVSVFKKTNRKQPRSYRSSECLIPIQDTRHVSVQVNQQRSFYNVSPRKNESAGKIVSENSAGLEIQSALSNNAPLKQSLYHLTRDLLNKIEWYSFELLCVRYFEAHSAVQEVKKTGAGADGGVDIKLKSNGETVLIQCKQRAHSKIGVATIREFFGTMVSNKVKYGVVITTTQFTEDAIAFSRSNDIDLIDGNEFWKKLDSLPVDKKAALENWLSTIDYTTPTCPACEIKFLKRVSKNGGEFWGCPNFPRCKRTIAISRPT
jgi:restriction system protein